MEKHVYVLGELNADLIMTGRDVQPEKNKEKLVDDFAMALGSSSAITACGLAGLGMSVRFVGVVGQDAFGEFVMKELTRSGVDTGFIHIDPHIGTGVTLSLSDSTDRSLLTYMGSIPHLRPERIPVEMFANARHIHFGSYYLQDGMRGEWTELFGEARKRGISTSFDTGWDPRERWNRNEISELLRHTDLFIPSEEELGRIFDTYDWEKAAKALPERPRIIAVKRGSRGAALIERDGSLIERNAFEVEVVDTTGAGDSFNAGLIYGYLNAKKGEELLDFANACGGLAVQRIGGASRVPSLSEVKAFLSALSAR